ncbi:MAG: hypothetical protein C0592_12685 [Marinilabiliales bacterium]|nr:MAG: hypothetical protein C0592_12685 [Marinilabiliales bacterium]
MKLISYIIALLMPVLLCANDGMFMSEGGQLIPVKETSIEMQKEILYLKYTPLGIEVSVYFEFYNPGEARDEIVGFVTPPASEDFMMSEEEREKIRTTKPEKHPYIEEFMVMVNEELLPYEVNYVAESGFNNDFFDERGGDYIYYFNVHFEKGINIIRHHYIFKGSGGLNEKSFAYRLTTGTMWAGGMIRDFNLVIDATNEDMTIFGPKHSGKRFLPWVMQGVGNFQTLTDATQVFMKSGVLQCHVDNFEPTSDLYIEFTPMHHYLLPITKGTELFQSGLLLNFFYFDPGEYKEGFQQDFESLSDEEIQLLINFMYASKGYVFKTESIKNDFLKCIWYIPDPNLNMENIEFSEREQALLNLLNDEREKRQ